MASIGLVHVSKRYGDVAAVRDLSLEIADGEFLYLVGPSGCGKTTVLRLIAGLEVPDEGEVRFDGEIVNSVSPSERDVAMVFEDFALYPNMDVRGNLAFPLRMRKTPAEAIRRRIAEVAEATEIEPILGRKPAALATGEAQHAAIGHAVIRETPAVFLLDDALSHLDARQRLEARAELARLRRDLGASVVGVTHDQAEALAIATRVGVMEDGRLRQLAPPRQLYEHPADTFVAGFIGTPGMNLLTMDLEDRAGQPCLRLGSMTWAPPGWRPPAGARRGDQIIVGFRPEHVRVGVSPGADEVGFTATCDLSEFLGHRRLIHLHLAGEPILASVAPGPDPAGAATPCSIPLDQLRFFEAASGRALDPR